MIFSPSVSFSMSDFFWSQDNVTGQGSTVFSFNRIDNLFLSSSRARYVLNSTEAVNTEIEVRVIDPEIHRPAGLFARGPGEPYQRHPARTL